jgi:hypothetical protein
MGAGDSIEEPRGLGRGAGDKDFTSDADEVFPPVPWIGIDSLEDVTSVLGLFHH